MNTNHKLQITYDESTGQVTAVHRCNYEIGGHNVGHSRVVAMPDDVAKAMIQFIDANRSEVETEAEGLAIMHAAAVSGRNLPNTKSLKVEGGAALFGGSTSNKKG